MRKAEYPSASCRESVWGVQAYSCELPDLHPGPHATFSQPTSVIQRDGWETEHPGWELKIGSRDDTVSRPIKSLPDLPHTSVPGSQAPHSREEFAEWASSEQRDKEIKGLTLGEVLDYWYAEYYRLGVKRATVGSGDVDEALATIGHRITLVTRLLHELRYGWGITLSPGEAVMES